MQESNEIKEFNEFIAGLTDSLNYLSSREWVFKRPSVPNMSVNSLIEGLEEIEQDLEEEVSEVKVDIRLATFQLNLQKILAYVIQNQQVISELKPGKSIRLPQEFTRFGFTNQIKHQEKRPVATDCF